MLRFIGFVAVVWFLFWTGIAQFILLMLAGFLTFFASF